MSIWIQSSFLPYRSAVASLAFDRDALGFEVRGHAQHAGGRLITVGAINQPDTSIVLEPAFNARGVEDTRVEPITRWSMTRRRLPSCSSPRTSRRPSSGSKPAAPRSSRSRSHIRAASETARSGQRYRKIARPFEWTFTRQKLYELIDRIDQHDPQVALAAYRSDRLDGFRRSPLP